MRQRPLMALAAAALLATASVARATDAAKLPASPAEVKRLAPAEVQKLVAAGQALVVDVRDAFSYEIEHAQGAILLGFGELEAKASQLPKEKLIVAYCT